MDLSTRPSRGLAGSRTRISDRGRARLGGLNRRLSQFIAMAAALVVVGALGATLAGGQAAARGALEDRFNTRIELTARFAAAYNADILEKEADVGARRLGGAQPSTEAFEAVVEDFGFEAAVLLDDQGRVLQVYPAKPALIGTSITGTYAHLRHAIEGVPAISNVVASAARGIPVVAFAAPFETAYGRRVLSGAFDASTTPLAAHLRNALPFAGGEVYLVDPTGSFVASNLAATGDVRTLAAIDPALASDESGHYLRDGQARWFTSTPVPGSLFRIVASVPETALYASLAGTASWLPWVSILALALGSVYTIHVLFALHRSREDYLVLTRTDPLTGLLNRRELSAIAERALLDARRRGEQIAVLLIDLDHFKRINDTHGHEAGDAVLRAAALRMQGALRSEDVIGRWGGEEFVAVLPATNLSQAVEIGYRLRDAIAATPMTFLDDRLWTITASIGCAEAVDERADQVIARADTAMYRAKRARNAVAAAPSPRGSRPVNVAHRRDRPQKSVTSWWPTTRRPRTAPDATR